MATKLPETDDYRINADGSITYKGKVTDEIREKAEKAAARLKEKETAALKPEVAAASNTREAGTIVENGENA